MSTNLITWLLAALLVINVAALFFLLRSLFRPPDDGIEKAVREELRLGRGESATSGKELRGEVEKRLEKVRKTVDKRLESIQKSNEKKLEQMRETVDEKLQKTLQTRLGESFKVVSTHLEAVQRGIGEMKDLAEGVGDLKRVLTNVKARGTWGEVQLEAILDQFLTPDQYVKNFQAKEDSGERVEFAIRLPGRSGTPVYLPIDSKFPQEDYLRILDATDAGDVDALKRASNALTTRLKTSAKEIKAKHVNPPVTVNFAILFLPTEGLYAEVLRQPGLLEQLQESYSVTVAGPTTLSAIINSFRLGFQTLAIEQRASEVWTVLSGVKTEFGKFGDVLLRLKNQLQTALTTIDKTEVRTRAMERRLREVEALPEDESAEIFLLPEESVVNELDSGSVEGVEEESVQ